MMKKIVMTLAAIATLSTAAIAAQDAATHVHGDTHAPHAVAHDATAPVDVYAAAMEAMHKDMMITPTGDADVDFARGMIPHHQGAIDMAKILKQHGKDAELQKLADDIIAAQEKEIAFLKGWLAQKGH